MAKIIREDDLLQGSKFSRLGIIITLGIMTSITGVLLSNDASAVSTFQADSPIHVNKVVISTLKVAKTVYIHNYKGSDIGSRIEQANKDCGKNICEIKVDQAGTIGARVSLSDNRILSFSQGQYIMKAQIVPGNNNEIRGAGSAATILVRDPSFFEGLKSDLRTNPPSDFNKISNAHLIKSDGAKNVYIHDLGIDGSTSKIGSYPLSSPHIPDMKFQMPKGTQTEIKISNSNNVLISKVAISGVQTHGIALSGTTDATIERSEISSNGWNAYQLLWIGSGNSNVLISNNYIHGSSHSAIHLESSSMVEISNNNLDGNRLNTFQTGSGGAIGIGENAHDISILSNKIINSAYTKGDSSNDYKAMAGHGIADHGSRIWIIKNDIENNEGAGININSVVVNGALKPVEDVSISGNIVKNNGVHAIGYDLSITADASAKNVVIADDNTLSGATIVRDRK